MEDFLKARKEWLLKELATVPEVDSRKEQEKEWIDQFLTQLDEDKNQPTPSSMFSPPSSPQSSSPKTLNSPIFNKDTEPSDTSSTGSMIEESEKRARTVEKDTEEIQTTAPASSTSLVPEPRVHTDATKPIHRSRTQSALSVSLPT